MTSRRGFFKMLGGLALSAVVGRKPSVADDFPGTALIVERKRGWPTVPITSSDTVNIVQHFRVTKTEDIYGGD